MGSHSYEIFALGEMIHETIAGFWLRWYSHEKYRIFYSSYKKAGSHIFRLFRPLFLSLRIGKSQRIRQGFHREKIPAGIANPETSEAVYSCCLYYKLYIFSIFVKQFRSSRECFQMQGECDAPGRSSFAVSLCKMRLDRFNLNQFCSIGDFCVCEMYIHHSGCFLIPSAFIAFSDQE